jgi:hypothetical protein
VDGALALGHVGGIEFETRLVTDPDDVDQLPGSIYHNLEQSQALRLLHELDGRFVLVAIPCQLEGIYSYIYQRAPELADKIHTTVGLLCGWQYSHHALRAIADFKGIDYDKITEISFRGDGPVGKLRMWTDEREVSAGRRVDFDYQVAFDRSFNTPRCHTCINHSNFLADIVVGDAWLPSTVSTKTGVSLLICRTPEVDQAVRAMERHSPSRHDRPQLPGGAARTPQGRGTLLSRAQSEVAAAMGTTLPPPSAAKGDGRAPCARQEVPRLVLRSDPARQEPHWPAERGSPRPAPRIPLIW